MLAYAALLSLVACVIHAMVLPGHWLELWQHGVFLLAATAGQGAGVLLLPSRQRWTLWATLTGNLLIVVIAVWAYGWGLPGWLYGDGREALNWQVIVCTVAEAALCVLCAAALYRKAARDPKAAPSVLAQRG